MSADHSDNVVRLPVVHATVRKPPTRSLAWYAGLGAMAALEIIEWPVALIVAASHALATHSRSPAAQELAEGAESGA